MDLKSFIEFLDKKDKVNQVALASRVGNPTFRDQIFIESAIGTCTNNSNLSSVVHEISLNRYVLNGDRANDMLLVHKIKDKSDYLKFVAKMNDRGLRIIPGINLGKEEGIRPDQDVVDLVTNFMKQECINYNGKQYLEVNAVV